ncbi:hypothetical protein BPAE_0122g00120 [Botrytis paeoniae]|uniref:Uncharacterized protein n=1 Tax=Botrytis paeoniae TaxID=278948 RepID=A0A4Z1FGK0_9HELO|nr:hypothetical protein BPAE_0122g00120 [Botrytis paeoniae]
MVSLADSERKEQATGSRLSGLPKNKSLRTKCKEIDPGSFKSHPRISVTRSIDSGQRNLQSNRRQTVGTNKSLYAPKPC